MTQSRANWVEITGVLYYVIVLYSLFVEKINWPLRWTENTLIVSESVPEWPEPAVAHKKV